MPAFVSRWWVFPAHYQQVACCEIFVHVLASIFSCQSPQPICTTFISEGQVLGVASTSIVKICRYVMIDVKESKLIYEWVDPNVVELVVIFINLLVST